MDPRTSKGHSPELLSCIGKELGRQLPEPLYLIPSEDKEQPDKSVMGDAGHPPRRRPTPGREYGYGRGEREPHQVEERRRQIDALLHRDALKDEINYMSGAQFEDFMADLFRQKGYPVRTTPGSGDQGVDLLLEVQGRKVAVQLKRWVAPVGNRVISHTLGGMLHYGAQEAWVVTTGSFTPKAKEMARSTGVRLIDGNELAEWLEGLGEEG
jgi:restriction system protein